MTSSADINILEAMTALINEQADRLAQTPQRLGKLAHMDPDQDHFQEGSIVSHEISSITGLCNPITAPLHLWIAGDGPLDSALRASTHTHGVADRDDGRRVAGRFCLGQFRQLARRAAVGAEEALHRLCLTTRRQRSLRACGGL